MGLFSKLKSKKQEEVAPPAAAAPQVSAFVSPTSYKPASAAFLEAAAAKARAAKEAEEAAAARAAAEAAAAAQAAKAAAAAEAAKAAAASAAAKLSSHDASSSVDGQRDWPAGNAGSDEAEYAAPLATSSLPPSSPLGSPSSDDPPATPEPPGRQASVAGSGLGLPESSCGSCTPRTGSEASYVLDGAGAAAGLPRHRSPCPSESESSAAASRVEWVAAAQQAVGAPAGQQQLSARRQIRRDMGPDTEERLHELFVEFASFGASKARLEELDSARFTKLCRECGLLCRRFTPGYADVAFTAAKKRKELRRLTFDEFCTALRLAAFRKQQPLEQVVRCVVASAGPSLNETTTPEQVRLYDDLSTWTGTQLQVATEAAVAAIGTPHSLPHASSAGSLGSSGCPTPGAARSGSLAELVQRQQSLHQEFIDPEKAAAEAAAAERRRRLAEVAIRAAEAEARDAVSRAAAATEAARQQALRAAAAAEAAESAVKEGEAAAERKRAEAAELAAAAEVQQAAARAAEREAAAALRKAAAAEAAGEKEAEAALAVASAKERRAKEAAANAWAVAAAATEAAETAAAAQAEAGAAGGWSEEAASAVAEASAEAEAAAMAAIVAARQEAEAAMLDALMQAEAAEAAVAAARAEAAAAEEALEAAKAEAAALLAAAATAEAAAETEAAAIEQAERRAAAAKEAAAVAAVSRRKAAARAKLDAEKAAAAAAERKAAAAEAAQQAANAAVRAEAAVRSRQRAQQKLSEALEQARASSLASATAAALAAPSTPEQPRGGPVGAAAASPDVSPAQAAAAALEAAQARFGDGSGVTAAQIKKVWLEFAGFGKKAGSDAALRMESALFAKLCRECHLVGERMTVAQVDLIFGRSTDKGRSLTFKQFMQQALPLLAEARGCQEAEVRMLVAAANGPVRRGTMPLHVKFHDAPTTRWGKA